MIAYVHAELAVNTWESTAVRRAYCSVRATARRTSTPGSRCSRRKTAGLAIAAPDLGGGGGDDLRGLAGVERGVLQDVSIGVAVGDSPVRDLSGLGVVCHEEGTT